MACKYLFGSKISLCKASSPLMIPSLFDLEVFCNGDPRSCPVYEEKQRSEHPEIPVAEKTEAKEPVRVA